MIGVKLYTQTLLKFIDDDKVPMLVKSVQAHHYS
jgi:hypothetical protein